MEARRGKLRVARMTTDLAAERPAAVLLAPDARVDTLLRVAEEFAAAAFHELSVARQLGTTNAGRPYPLATDFTDKDAEKRRREIRAAWKAAGDNVKTTLEILRFVKDVEPPGGAPQPDAPVDPATRALLEREEKKRRVIDTVARAGTMISEAGDPFSG